MSSCYTGMNARQNAIDYLVLLEVWMAHWLKNGTPTYQKMQMARLQHERDAYEQRLSDIRKKNKRIVESAKSESTNAYLQMVQQRFLARGKTI